MNEDESVIKKTERRLYSNDPGNLERRRTGLSDLGQPKINSWAEGGDNTGEMFKKNKRKNFSILNLLLLFSFLFFLGAIGFAYHLYTVGTNTISPSNVDLSVAGPITVKGGEEFQLQIAITNKNNTPLEYAELFVSFPSGTKISGSNPGVTQFRKNLGTIAPNQIITESIKVSLFGEENSEREIIATMEYRNENSNAIIEKNSYYKTSISTSPLSLLFDIPSDANSNQEIVLNAKIVSNSKETLRDVLVNLNYPPGFIFKSAVPSPTSGDSIWELGDMKQSAEKKIKIIGVLQGQDNEQKTFRASVGIRSNKDSSRVDVPFASSLKTLVIKRPFIGVDLALNGVRDEIVFVSDGQNIRGDIDWINNLPVKLLHGELTVKISGDVFNKATVNSPKGFFRSGDNTIIWNKASGGIPDSVEVGDGGRITFSFSALPLLSGQKSIFKNPEINVDIKFRGVRSAEGREDGSFIETNFSKKIRLNSNIQVAGRVLYHSGPFKNEGPLPPIRDSETTYTVVWSLVNSSNDVSGVKIKTTLPPNARWIGTVSPGNEKVEFTPLTGEIIWDVGSVKAGSGVTIPAKEVAFQIGITPNLASVGSYPVVIYDTLLSGIDDFTGKDLKYSRRSLDTKLGADPLIKGIEGEPVR